MEKTKALLVRQLNYEIEKIVDEENDNINISQAFDGIGKFGEILVTSIFPGSIGSASKGGCAFDNHCRITNKKREVKTCCIIQPKICNKCVKINKNHDDQQHNQVKVPFFQKKCIFCEETDDFSYPKDSRFGIDCKAHFTYESQLSEYIFHLIDYKDNKIIFESFIIYSNNKYFRKMLATQLEKSNSHHCNFMPKSHDFYSSGPIKILEMIYTRDKEIESFFFNPENKEICEYPIELLSKDLKKSLDLQPSGNSQTHIAYEELESKLEPKKKNFGKLRGKVVRI